jgi:hypothetical protein
VVGTKKSAILDWGIQQIHKNYCRRKEKTECCKQGVGVPVTVEEKRRSPTSLYQVRPLNQLETRVMKNSREGTCDSCCGHQIWGIHRVSGGRCDSWGRPDMLIPYSCVVNHFRSTPLYKSIVEAATAI